MKHRQIIFLEENSASTKVEEWSACIKSKEEWKILTMMIKDIAKKTILREKNAKDLMNYPSLYKHVSNERTKKSIFSLNKPYKSLISITQTDNIIKRSVRLVIKEIH